MPDINSPPPGSTSMDISSWSFSDSSDPKPEELDFEPYFDSFSQSQDSQFNDDDDNNNDTSNNINTNNINTSTNSSRKDHPRNTLTSLQKPLGFKNDDILPSEFFHSLAPKSLLSSDFDDDDDDIFAFPSKRTSKSQDTHPEVFSFHQDLESIQNDVEMRSDGLNDHEMENSGPVFKIPGKSSAIPIRQPLARCPDSAKNILFDRYQPQLSHPSSSAASSSSSSMTGPGPLIDSPQLSPGTYDYRTGLHSPVRGPSPVRSSACSIASNDSTITLESSRASSPVSRSRSVSPVRGLNLTATSPRHHPVVGLFAPSPIRLTPALQQPPPLLQPQPQLAAPPISMDISVSAPPPSASHVPAPPSSPSKIIKSNISRSPTRSSVSLVSTGGPGSPNKLRRGGKHNTGGGGSISISSSAAAQAAVAAAINTEMSLASGPPSTPRVDSNGNNGGASHLGGHARTQSQTSLLYASPFAFAPPASPSTVPSPVYLGDPTSAYLQSVQNSPVRSGHQQHQSILMPMPMSYTSLQQQQPPPHSQLQFVPQLGPELHQNLFSTGSTSPQRMASPQRMMSPVHPSNLQHTSSLQHSPVHQSPIRRSPLTSSAHLGVMSPPPLMPAPPAVTMAVSPVAVPMNPASHNLLDLQMQYPGQSLSQNQFQGQAQFQSQGQAENQNSSQTQIPTSSAAASQTPSFDETVKRIVSEGSHHNQVFMQTLEMHNPILANSVRQAVLHPSSASNTNNGSSDGGNDEKGITEDGELQGSPAKGGMSVAASYMQNLSFGNNNGMMSANVNNGLAVSNNSNGSSNISLNNNVRFEQPVFQFPPPDSRQSSPVSKDRLEQDVNPNGSASDPASLNSSSTSINNANNNGSRFGPSALIYATGGPGHRKSMLPPGTVDKYCRGPDKDGKFECTFEGCTKIFRRRYNVRSHIQTHLCDRPYACDVCPATFVRPHDLRRHMKCHATVKPHVCPCGQSFTRHDALSRHRQRMICVGGIETPGKPKKVPGRRGRPKSKKEEEEEEDEEEEEEEEEEERDDDDEEDEFDSGNGSSNNSKKSSEDEAEEEEDDSSDVSGEEGRKQGKRRQRSNTKGNAKGLTSNNSAKSAASKPGSSSLSKSAKSTVSTSSQNKGKRNDIANGDTDCEMDDCTNDNDEDEDNGTISKHIQAKAQSSPCSNVNIKSSTKDGKNDNTNNNSNKVSGNSCNTNTQHYPATPAASEHGDNSPTSSGVKRTPPIGTFFKSPNQQQLQQRHQTLQKQQPQALAGSGSLESVYSTPLINSHGFQSPPKSGSIRGKKQAGSGMARSGSTVRSVSGTSLSGYGNTPQYSPLQVSPTSIFGSSLTQTQSQQDQQLQYQQQQQQFEVDELNILRNFDSSSTMMLQPPALAAIQELEQESSGMVSAAPHQFSNQHHQLFLHHQQHMGSSSVDTSFDGHSFESIDPHNLSNAPSSDGGGDISTISNNDFLDNHGNVGIGKLSQQHYSLFQNPQQLQHQFPKTLQAGLVVGDGNDAQRLTTKPMVGVSELNHHNLSFSSSSSTSPNEGEQERFDFYSSLTNSNNISNNFLNDEHYLNLDMAVAPSLLHDDDK